MSTGQQHESKTPDLSFESIDDQINDYVNDFIDQFESLDSGEMAVVAKPQTAADRAQQLMTTAISPESSDSNWSMKSFT